MTLLKMLASCHSTISRKYKVPVNVFHSIQSTVTAVALLALLHTLYIEKVYYLGMAS